MLANSLGHSKQLKDIQKSQIVFVLHDGGILIIMKKRKLEFTGNQIGYHDRWAQPKHLVTKQIEHLLMAKL